MSVTIFFFVYIGYHIIYFSISSLYWVSILTIQRYINKLKNFAFNSKEHNFHSKSWKFEVKKVTFHNAKFGQNYSDEREPLNNKNKPTQTKVHWDKTDKFQIKVIRIQASKLVSLMDHYHDENFREANFKFHNHRLFQ